MNIKTRKRLACPIIALTLLFGLASTARVLGDGKAPKETPGVVEIAKLQSRGFSYLKVQ